jgi:hypothetical protein
VTTYPYQTYHRHVHPSLSLGLLNPLSRLLLDPFEMHSLALSALPSTQSPSARLLRASRSAGAFEECGRLGPAQGSAVRRERKGEGEGALDPAAEDGSVCFFYSVDITADIFSLIFKDQVHSQTIGSISRASHSAFQSRPNIDFICIFSCPSFLSYVSVSVFIP